METSLHSQYQQLPLSMWEEVDKYIDPVYPTAKMKIYSDLPFPKNCSCPCCSAARRRHHLLVRRSSRFGKQRPIERSALARRVSPSQTLPCQVTCVDHSLQRLGKQRIRQSCEVSFGGSWRRRKLEVDSPLCLRRSDGASFWWCFGVGEGLVMVLVLVFEMEMVWSGLLVWVWVFVK